MLEWSEDYATGDDDIDHQHQVLFDKINMLNDKINKGEGLAYLENMIRFMGNYTKAHFIFEETCMQRHRCPIAQQNKEAHKKFLDAFQGFRNELAAKGVSEELLSKVQRAAESWIKNHIMRIDTHLKACVNKDASQMSAQL